MTKTFFCSWCGKSDHEVAKLLAGPNTFICNECVELCMDILRGDKIDTIKTRLTDDKLREVITHEVREAFRQHESAFAAIVKTAVDRAFADLLKEPLP